jgi:transcriptional regulator with XRE-family HTH domain
MFWNVFLTLCEQNKKTPTGVITELSISRGSVTHWKSGKVPQHSTLLKLADYFGVSVDYLLGKEEQTKQNTPDEPKLTEGEKMLLDLFRRIPEDKQPLVLQMIRAASGSQE